MRNVAKTKVRIAIAKGHEILSTKNIGDSNKFAAGNSFGSDIDIGKISTFIKSNPKAIEVDICITSNW
jgi:hypothetical protein